MREGLFSSLQAGSTGLVGRTFLDLYAGSGAVGLEAASRGASRVVLVEREPAALKVMRSNAEGLGVSGVVVVALPVERFLAGEPSAFDAVYVDPPYAEPVGATLTALTAGWLAPEAVVCVERSSRDAALEWPEGLAGLRSRKYGDTTLWYGRAS